MMLTGIPIAFVIVIATCVGSFANVLIYRVPRKIPFAHDTSRCPECDKRIMPYDLIPIFSYVILGGRCRYCKSHISIKYPVVEAVAGALAVSAIWRYGYSVAAVTGFLIFVVLLCVSFIDAEYMIIPNGFVLSLAVLCIAHAVLCEEPVGLQSRILGFFVLSVPMFALAFFIKDAFGGGDIKLIAVCGFLLGVKLVLLAGFIAVLLGGFWGMYVKYIKKDTDATHIAFGQYICIGVFMAMLVGEEILNMYMGLWLY